MTDDWDPLPSDREHFRSTSTGDRGYRVRRGGIDKIRLDRPMQEILFAMTPEWIPDEYGSLLLDSQVAAVAFAADRAVCIAVGLHMESRKTWLDLSDSERIKFLRDGPPRNLHPVRGIVYDANIAALKPFTRD